MIELENSNVVRWLVVIGGGTTFLAKVAVDLFDNNLLLTMYIPGLLVLGTLGLILLTDWQGICTKHVAITQERLRERGSQDRFQWLFAEPVILRVCGMLLVAGAVILLVGVGREVLPLVTLR